MEFISRSWFRQHGGNVVWSRRWFRVVMMMEKKKKILMRWCSVTLCSMCYNQRG